MLYRTKWVFLTLTLTLLFTGCKPKWWVDPVDANGGAFQLTLPFPSGEYWNLTQAYNGGSHVNWGFGYGDDTYALDFSQAGCEPYGKAVTPIAPGTVLKVTTEGNHDSGYGNSVLIDHGYGYVSRYAHLAENLVKVGYKVNTYNVIGRVGNTGYVNGFACPDHPGTHLHLVLYKDGVSIKPEPLSGLTDLDVGCWYSRDGYSSCSGDPGDYDPTNNLHSGNEFDFTLVSVNPPEGSEDNTNFVWVAVIDSPGDKPEATLWLRNPLHNVNYPFTMSTDSEESPWVFTYRKSLQDSVDYPFWVEADGKNGHMESSESVVEVYSKSSMDPDYSYFLERPDDGEAGENLFTWEALFESDLSLNMKLKIVNPEDGHIYSFSMDEDELQGDDWVGSYSKTLSDQTIYSYWVEGSNSSGMDNSKVYSVEAY